MNDRDYDILYDFLESDAYISTNKNLIFALGLHETVIFCELLSRSRYFAKHNQLTPDGYFYNTVDDLYLGTGIGEKPQRTAIKNLIKKGLINMELRGVPPKRYFKICNPQKIIKVIREGMKRKEEIEKKLERQKSQILPMGGFKSSQTAELNPADRRINNTNINNTKSKNLYLGIDKIDSKHLGIPNQQNKTSNTLVAEATQIYPSNQPNQKVGNSKVPISFAGYCRSYKVDPDVIKVVNYYLEKYKEQLGKEHPRLKPHQWLQVTEEILSPLCDEQLENPRWIEITPSQLYPMIDQHFLTSYKSGGYSILHFCNENIRLRRYYEVHGEE